MKKRSMNFLLLDGFHERLRWRGIRAALEVGLHYDGTGERDWWFALGLDIRILQVTPL